MIFGIEDHSCGSAARLLRELTARNFRASGMLDAIHKLQRQFKVPTW